MVKMKWAAAAGLGLIGTLWAMDAVAQGPGAADRNRGKIDFSALDTDGNGSVSIAEMQAVEAARFEAMDSNGDGLISAEEMSKAAVARVEERAGKHFAKMLAWRDSDGDGALSPWEFGTNRGERMFSRVDANHDGEITEAEFEQAKAHGGQRGGGKRRHGG